MIKRFLVTWFIAFLVFLAAFRPHDALGAVKTIGSITVDILTGVGDFFSSLVS